MGNDMVEFAPEPSQLARVAGGDTAASPPAWLALALIAVALGVSLSLALPPATKVTRGSVSDGASRSDLIRAADLHGVAGR